MNNTSSKNNSSSMASATVKRKPYIPSRAEAVHFDPTAIGLPANWSLTSFSTLKG